MRRGLISWSRQEVPENVLEARVARLQKAMRSEHLDAVLAYTSTAQPSAVSWLTHFVPYANEGLLVLFTEGPPAFFTSFSKRVQGWIREVSHIGELKLGPHLGRNAVNLIEERLGPSGRVPRLGLLERDQFPSAVTTTLMEAGWREGLLDATSLFAAVRQPADEAEIKLARHTDAIATKALAAIAPGTRRASRVLSAIESTARLDGAEEVFLRIAPDLAASSVLKRMEGDAELGARSAVELSLAYKGVWVRATKSFSSAAAPASWNSAQGWFAGAVSELSPGRLTLDEAGSPGTVANWTVESCLGSQPLSLVACGGARLMAPVSSQSRALPPGALGVACIKLDLPDGPWHASSNFILAVQGQPTRLLAH